MSLYHLVHGQNELAEPLLYALNLKPAHIGRFRDCYLQRDKAGALEIHVYTRNGGGNRAGYEDNTKALRAHPLYLRDYDDKFDCTYASYVFRVPEQMRAGLESIVSKVPEVIPLSSDERWKTSIEKIKTSPDDSAFARLKEAFADVLAPLKGKPGGDDN